MVYSAIAFLLGCVTILQLGALPDWPIWLVLVLLSVITLRWRLFWLTAFFLGMFWTGGHSALNLNDRLPPSLTGEDFTLRGQIVGLPQKQDRRLRFLLQTQEGDIRLPEKIRLNWYYPPADLPQAGEQWQLTVRLKPPYGMVNPGSFDYEGWLFQQDIGATGYVRKAVNNQRQAAANMTSLSHWRQILQNRLQKLAVDSPQRALIEGLTIGVRSNMTPLQWQVLRDTGTSHLLAISGLHIGLAATLGFFLGRWLWCLYSPFCLHLPAQQFGAVIAIISALGYALIAGMSIPSQRALIMVTVAMGAILLRRKVLSYQVLAVSLWAVLLWNPTAVLSAGFWLSFAAVAVILYVSQNRRPVSKWHWTRIHIWIAIGLTPLLLVFFNSTSLISPLANLLAVPLVSLLVVPILLLAMLVMLFSETLSRLLLQLADWLLAILWYFLSWLAELPLALWETASLPISIIVLSLLSFIWLMAPRGWPARWLSLFLLLPLIFYQPARPDKGSVWLTILDVGQGLAVVAETTNKTLVFDTGPKFGDFNTGDAVVLPFLQHRGVKELDMLVISHGDNDHIGGAEAILKSLPVIATRTSVAEQLPDAKVCVAGQGWRWDEVKFEFLHPSVHTIGSANERSCVLKISSRYGSILLTGDIEKQAEASLVKNNKKSLAADIMLVAHHGSRSSSSAAFIDAVSPQIAVIASGFNNRYQFPANEVVQRFRERRIPLINTAYSGAVIFQLDSTAPITAVRWRQQDRKLWRADATD
ncbi:MAG TPA: DNA internalization-related competence protein ComEC/Rec2 [Methylophaga sp.]|nr:DNA internalization-related competence protein ComEC/Rec2 [Methylophaga sp.]